MKIRPYLDQNFKPISEALKEYEADVKNSAHVPLRVCVERESGYNFVCSIDIHTDSAKQAENYGLIERLIKSALWVAGGYKICICGSEYVYGRIKADYAPGGVREFDARFMSTVYERPFEVVAADDKDFPKEKRNPRKVGGHLDGCRIGFDAGGSDCKVSAVIDGKVVFSEEVVWHPKLSTDWKYQYREIKAAFSSAAEKMPRVDAVGVSSAGVHVGCRIMVSSLFISVPEEDRKKHVENMYLDIANELGYKIDVENDGDVAALAGALDLKKNRVLGVAMGTSEAGGYVNADGNLNGWINELAFVPVDMGENAARDEWSGDIGCGAKYLSQDGVIRLSSLAGIVFPYALSPAEKLEKVRIMFEKGDLSARRVFEDVGIYLGYSLAFYSKFYDINVVLLLGRVTSGAAGETIARKAKEVLKIGYPELDIDIVLPDEERRRVGQSIAAASLVGI